MAGGPIGPSSTYFNDTTGRIYPSFYAGATGNISPVGFGAGVKASLDADSVLEMRFPMPPSLPTGTLKLRSLHLANATSGIIKYTIADGFAGPSDIPGNVTLTSESQSSVTWNAGDANRYKETKVSLSSAASGNAQLVVGVTYQTSGWTLATPVTSVHTVIWE